MTRRTQTARLDFWLTKLNQFNGNFVNAEMVKAFTLSGEYRKPLRAVRGKDLPAGQPEQPNRPVHSFCNHGQRSDSPTIGKRIHVSRPRERGVEMSSDVVRHTSPLKVQ